MKSNSRRAAALSVLIAAAVHSAGALAGRPLQTEDAGVLGRGECELEGVGARASAREAPTERAGGAQVGCGFGFDSQAALFAGRARAAGEQVDELALVGKTALRELTDSRTGVVIAWALGAQRAGGGSFRHEATEVRAVVTHPVGPWLLHANLGAARSQAERQNSTIWSVAAERTGLGPIDAMAEVFGDDRDDPWINAGLRWTAIVDRLFIDGSYGVQTNRGRARLLTVGLKYAF
jgi:hypothetical protein